MALTIQGGVGPLPGFGTPNSFNVLSTPNNSFHEGTLRTTLVTHGYGQAINVGDGGHTNLIFGDLYVQAAAGPNRVNVNDSADLLVPPISINQHTDASSLYTEVFIGYGRIDVADGGTAFLNVTAGSNLGGPFVLCTVNGTAPNTAVTLTTSPAAKSVVNIAANSGTVTVNTHGADDAVNLGDAMNTVDSILGTINVNRVEGADTLNVNDQGESAPEDYESTQNLIQRSPLTSQGFNPTQTINYSGVTNVVINGGTARDLYGVGGESAGTAQDCQRRNGLQ